jgi:DnaK suppressor protein
MTERTRKQLDQIRAALLQRKQDLAREIEEVRNHLDEDQERVAEDARDGGAPDAQTGIDHAMVARDIREIQDIDAALKRIEDGDYGICIDCGAEIAPARIAAYPTAKRCLPCQVKRERARWKNAD